jgi:ketosteroid isomerase-like protein
MKDILDHFEATSGGTYDEREEEGHQQRDQKNQRLTSRNEVISAIRDWWEAWFGGDLDALATLTCERYIEFAGDGEVIVAGKTALVEQGRSTQGVAKIYEWAILKPVVRRLEDAAVCDYYLRIAGRIGHTRFHMDGLVTDVLIKVGDIWKLVAHHRSFPDKPDPARLTDNLSIT